VVLWFDGHEERDSYHLGSAEPSYYRKCRHGSLTSDIGAFPKHMLGVRFTGFGPEAELVPVASSMMDELSGLTPSDDG
jgi:hypothetical protein